MKSKKIQIPQWMQCGQKCWIQYPHNNLDPYLKAIFQSINQMNLKAKCKLQDGNYQQHKINYIHRRSNYSSLVDDMIDLDVLNDAQLLHNVKQRFTDFKIFTYVGPTLLVVNPYQLYPQLYTTQRMSYYFENIVKKPSTILAYKELEPHIFAISANALKEMKINCRNQTIVISGQSGAGKTQTNKYCMKFFTFACQRKKVQKQFVSIQDKVNFYNQILSCNPILQAFGNAKTIRNDNSSRFGKYVTIQFNRETKAIEGATIRNYLLEKSRIINQAQQECNFHIFYSIMKGPQNLKKLYYLQTKYKHVTGQPLKIAFSYQQISQALKCLKINEQLIWRILSAILNLSNIQFNQSTYNDHTPCQVEESAVISKLLQIDNKIIDKALTSYTLTIGDQNIQKPFLKKQCRQTRDSLAKSLYQKLFSWLVDKLNNTIKAQEKKQGFLQLGLLDIYGFEVFKNNSFEQLCINYTNQRLQQLYINQVFKQQKTIFDKQGLLEHMNQIFYQDNQGLLQLLDMNYNSIYNLLDENCTIASPDQQSFLNSIRNHNKNHASFPKANLNLRQSFIIKHTPRQVQYNAIGFRQKNKDSLRDDIVNSMMSSQIKELRDMWADKQKSKKFFLGKKFRIQINQLMSNISNPSTDIHFIRCIKPNQKKQPKLFISGIALTQIKYLGILDTIRIRKQGFPIRMTYQKFYQEYGLLGNNILYGLKNQNQIEPRNYQKLSKQLFQEHLKQLPRSEYLFGKTKIFIREEGSQIIKTIYHKKKQAIDKKVKIIQRTMFRYTRLKKLRKMISSTVTIQKNLRRFLEQQKYLKQKRAANRIKNWYIKCRNQRKIRQLRDSVICVQKILRTKYYKQIYDKKIKAVISIQKAYKKYLITKKLRVYKIGKDILFKDIMNQVWFRIGAIQRNKINIFMKGFMVMVQNKQKIQKVDYIISGNVINKYLKQLGLQIYNQKRHKAAYCIQGHFKGYLYRCSIKQYKRASLIIQRYWRKYYYSKLNSKRIFQQFYQPYRYDKGQLKKSIQASLFCQKKPTSQNLEHALIYNLPGKSKANLFLYIIDLHSHIILNQVYPEHSWFKNWTKVFKDGAAKGNMIQWIQVGQAHTMCVNDSQKIYSWGWNDYFQQGIDKGNPNYPAQQSLYPSRIKFLLVNKNQTYLQLQNPYSVHHFGKIDQKINLFQRYGVANKVKLQNGILKEFSGSGWLNFAGFKNQRVLQVECGSGHIICRTNLKKVYTWGMGLNGQLGQNKIVKLQIPKPIKFQQQVTPQQVSATFSSSIIITNERKIYWWGSNGTIQMQMTPKQFKMSQKSQFLSQGGFSPLRIVSSWSPTMSVIALTMVDHRCVFENQVALRNKILSLLMAKWNDQDIRSVRPPFDASISKYFSQKCMKMPIHRANIQPQSRRRYNQLQRELQVMRKVGQQQSLGQFSFNQNYY